MNFLKRSEKVYLNEFKSIRTGTNNNQATCLKEDTFALSTYCHLGIFIKRMPFIGKRVK